LVEAGADVHAIFRRVYETVQFAKLKLLARALERAQIYDGGRLVVSYLLRSDFTDIGAAEAYSEGIIDYLRMVEGADMAALIREPRDGPARRVSLRASNDELDVSAIARKVGWRRSPASGWLLERRFHRGDHRVHQARVPRECPHADVVPAA